MWGKQLRHLYWNEHYHLGFHDVEIPIIGVTHLHFVSWGPTKLCLLCSQILCISESHSFSTVDYSISLRSVISVESLSAMMLWTCYDDKALPGARFTKFYKKFSDSRVLHPRYELHLCDRLTEWRAKFSSDNVINIWRKYSHQVATCKSSNLSIGKRHVLHDTDKKVMKQLFSFGCAVYSLSAIWLLPITSSDRSVVSYVALSACIYKFTIDILYLFCVRFP